METSDEILSSLKNLRYYSQKIAEASKKQFDLDYKKGQELGINTGIGSVRFDCLGAIALACNQIDIFCDNIEANLKTAVEQDKLLFSEVEP